VLFKCAESGTFSNVCWDAVPKRTSSDRQLVFLCGISISPLNEALVQQPLSDLGLIESAVEPVHAKFYK